MSRILFVHRYRFGCAVPYYKKDMWLLEYAWAGLLMDIIQISIQLKLLCSNLLMHVR